MSNRKFTLTQVKIFHGPGNTPIPGHQFDPLQHQVNEWLEANLEDSPDMKIVDRQISVTLQAGTVYATIAIFYEVPMETASE